MSILTLRLAGVGVVVLLTLTLLALLPGQGESMDQALAAYESYLPGQRLPARLTCQPMMEYITVYGLMCSLDGAPYCQKGYVVVRDEVITYLRLTGCDFPAAYLIAQRGRFERITRYRRVTMLGWQGMSAQVQQAGRFHMLQSVTSVGWWARPELRRTRTTDSSHRSQTNLEKRTS